ncbi:adenosylhomocysteinase [Sulfoacidibacillus thermotolerans]|uniref:Adenosylhomocysteinase n=1 Tax=Sulfoacidibacillus thermotolerans TaxID=1765684 RepID=A0A2U3D6S0_SULT2|nr:adenosylhomocysteinase [Sulfoacidibacillus thermotolerans]PWI56961.1 adenosylhomocysteinase [Sulfoacidibacillus thermotolerans]
MKGGAVPLSQIADKEANVREISRIRNYELYRDGLKKISWVKEHMPLLRSLEEQFRKEQPFAGKRVVICLHLEAKTAYLAKVVQAGGAKVAVVASNPLSTQDDVVAALVHDGIYAFAWHGASATEYNEHIQAALDFHPELVIDDGGDLVSTLHRERKEQVAEIKGGCEETTTGILRLRAMEEEGVLGFPMIAVNDAYSKYLFDNRYGTGQSVWDGIMRTTNLVVAGKTVVVVGYGWCGKGVALRAAALGAKVIVTEVDPIKALEALMDGYSVMPIREAAKLGDFFITVTGDKNCIVGEHFDVMKDGALLANAGHFDVEISIPDLRAKAVSVQTVRKNVEEYTFADGRKVYLLAEGRLVNLAAGDGHPAEVMDMTFALQALALRYVNEEPLSAGVHRLPQALDERVARMRLAASGVEIDELTEEQRAYLASWRSHG